MIALLNNSREISINTGSYAGHFRQTVPFTIIESAINLTTSLIGVCFLGIYGVLLGTVAAHKGQIQKQRHGEQGEKKRAVIGFQVLWYARSYDKLRPDAPPNNQALATTLPAPLKNTAPATVPKGSELSTTNG